jgi:Ca2+-binding RTX toxin-like protein
MKRFSAAILLGLLPVIAVIVYVVLADTVVCTVTGGNDTCAGTANADTILLPDSGGNDTVNANAGNDVIYSNDVTGTNTINGQDGSDIIIDAAGASILNGGAGNDKIFGNGGNDTVSGGDGDDYIDCGPGADNCDGNAGNDIIIGGQGTDTFTAGSNAGDDVFIIFAGDSGGGNEDIQCGAGTDVVIFVGFGNRIFTFPVPDAGAGTFTNTTADCEILIGG